MPALHAVSSASITLAITDRATARRELNYNGTVAWTHVISIGDPGSRLAASPRRWGSQLLRLEFDDVDPQSAGLTPAEVQARWGYRAATREQVQAIVDYARMLPDGARLLVQCEQGISRSSAAAVIALMSRGIDGPTAHAIARASRPQMRPNGWMLWLGLDVLASNT